MSMTRASAALALSFLLACGDDGGGTGGGSAAGGGDDGSGAGSTSTGESGGTGGGSGGSGSACDGAGTPEMTGPIEGLRASYPAGDPIDIGVPVDEDTARVIVGIYEVGSALYLGGTAEETAGSTTQSLSFFAGVADGEVGEFYLSVELCSTSVCTTPLVRNTYQREDRTAPELAAGETYVQIRENVGGDGTPQVCPTDIAIQSFLIE